MTNTVFMRHQGKGLEASSLEDWGSPQGRTMEILNKLPMSEILQKAIFLQFSPWGQLSDFQVYFRVYFQVLVNQRNHITSQSCDHILASSSNSELKTFPV